MKAVALRGVPRNGAGSGDVIVQINRTKTPLDDRATLCINDNIGRVLAAVKCNKQPQA